MASPFQLPNPSILRGWGAFYFYLLHNYLMNILQEIFKDNYEIIQYTLHPRDVEMDNISKMIHCGDPAFGGAMYACTHCGNLKFVPFRCKSRFCPTCGVKYSQERSTQMAFKLIRCTHRHCVFTIDEELRHFFLDERSLLDCLFQAVRSVVLRLFHNLNKSKNFVPGFVCVLHTFGPLWSGTHIFTVSLRKGASPMTVSGGLSNISTILSFGNLFRLLSSTFLNPALGPLSKRPRLLSTAKIKMAFTFMPNQISVIPMRWLNISAAISVVPSLYLSGLIPMMVLMLLFTTTVMKTMPLLKKRFLP